MANDTRSVGGARGGAPGGTLFGNGWRAWAMLGVLVVWGKYEQAKGALRVVGYELGHRFGVR